MAQFASDAFGGTEGTTLSTYNADWQKPAAYSGSAEIASGRVRASATATIASYYHTGTPASANYSVSADLVFKTASSAGYGYAGVVGRLDTSGTPTPDQYRLRWAGGTVDKWQFYEFTGGVATLIYESPSAVTVTDESTVNIRLEMDDEVRCYVDDALIYTHSSPTVTAAGKAAIYVYDTEAPSDTTGVHIDNFSADDLSATQTLTPSLFSDGDTFHAPTVTGGAVVLTPSLLTNTNTFYAPVVQRIQIVGGYERSSVNLSGSSVTGVGDSAVVVIKPRVQESEYLSSLTGWYEPSAKITGIDGFRPTFRFSDYASSYSDGKYINPPWGTRKPVFSYDRETWHFFDTVTVNADNIEFRHSTAFTSDTVYIGKNRQISVEQVGNWVNGLETTYSTLIEPTIAAAAFTPTLTSWPAQAFIAGEFASQTNELSETIPATPFYAFQINDTSLMPLSGEKRLAVLICGTHAGEDLAFWPWRAMVEHMLGASADAQYLRRHFKILAYPMLNAPGRAGGGFRGSFTQGTGGEDDANRHFRLSDTSGLDIVAVSRGAMITDMDGGIPAWGFDFHNTSSNSVLFGAFYAPGDVSHAAFDTLLEANTGITHADAGDPPTTTIGAFFTEDVGVPFFLFPEFGDYSAVSDATYAAYGPDFAATIVDFFQTLESTLLTNSTTFYTPTVVVDGGPQTLTPELFTDSETFHAATVTPGAVTLAPSLYADADTFHAAEVASGFNLHPPAFADDDAFYAATVSVGAVTLTPGLFEDADTFYAANVAIAGMQTLEPIMFTDADTFYVPTVTGGMRTIGAARIAGRQIQTNRR